MCACACVCVCVCVCVCNKSTGTSHVNAPVTMAIGESSEFMGRPSDVKQLRTSVMLMDSEILATPTGGGATICPNMRSGVVNLLIIFL